MKNATGVGLELMTFVTSCYAHCAIHLRHRGFGNWQKVAEFNWNAIELRTCLVLLFVLVLLGWLA